MSYLRAEDVLLKNVLELVQQYVDGQIIYIPRKERRSWGEGTDTKKTIEWKFRVNANGRRVDVWLIY